MATNNRLRPAAALLAVLAVACDFSVAATPLKPARTNVGDFQVHYFTRGQGQEGVVYIHGWSCDHSFWRAQGPALRRYPSVLVDLPGHGASSKPQVPYTQDVFADSVAAVMVAAGLRRAVLVGHSMGGVVAVKVLGKYPEMVQGLVLVDSVIPLAGTSKEAEARRAAQYQAMLKSLRNGDYKAELAKAAETMAGRNVTGALRDEIVQKMQQAAPRQVGVSALEGIASLPPVVGAWKELPVLAVQALRPDNASYFAQLRKVFPKLQTKELDGAGHFLMLEQPDPFNQALLGFFESVLGK